jgi:hypothetical protein
MAMATIQIPFQEELLKQIDRFVEKKVVQSRADLIQTATEIYIQRKRAESETGVDFFSWDLSHNEKEFKVDVVMDKEGVQEKKFMEGEHHIAVQKKKKKGLSGTDKIKINAKK